MSSKPKKQYVFPLKSPEDKQKIRDWVGTHNGMSILKSEEGCVQEGDGVNLYDIYVLGITNPKTEMLFILSFPEAIEKERFDAKCEQVWKND